METEVKDIQEEKAFKRYKRKAFLWDQFWLPLKELIFNIKHIKAALSIIAIVDLFVFRDYLYSYIIPGLLWLILVLYDDIYKSWKSGEFIKNYRDHKYPEYRKAIKEVRRARKENNKKQEVVILDDNPLSIASYMEEHPEVEFGDKINEEEK